jgi:hypothetical protein
MTDEKNLKAMTEVSQVLGAKSFTVCTTTEPNVCEDQCPDCAGKTHHWIDDFLDDEPVRACKHCLHIVPLGEPEKHPSGCDCPDCSGEWMSSCGVYVTDGLHCPKCLEEPPEGCGCGYCDESGCHDPFLI